MHATRSSLKTKTAERKLSESQAKAHEGREHLEQRQSETEQGPGSAGPMA